MKTLAPNPSEAAPVCRGYPHTKPALQAFTRRHQSPGGDNHLVLHHRAVQHRGAYAHQNAVAQGAAVQAGAVADGDVLANGEGASRRG